MNDEELKSWLADMEAYRSERAMIAEKDTEIAGLNAIVEMQLREAIDSVHLRSERDRLKSINVELVHWLKTLHAPYWTGDSNHCELCELIQRAEDGK